MSQDYGQQQWQPQRYDPAQHYERVQDYAQQQYPGAVAPYAQQQPAPARRQPAGLTSAGHFWYVLGCVAFGAAYFAKVPAKRALADFGVAEMTGAEKFWYVLMCIAFGAGYFAKLSTAKALSEMSQFR